MSRQVNETCTTFSMQICVACSQFTFKLEFLHCLATFPTQRRATGSGAVVGGSIGGWLYDRL